MPTTQKIVQAPPSVSSDPGGMFRFASLFVAVGAAGAAVGIALEGALGRRKRAGLAAAAGCVAVAAGAGVRTPRLAAHLIAERPSLSLALGATPVALAPLAGRRFNAFHVLSITGIGMAAAALDPSRRRPLAATASAYWIVTSVGQAGTLTNLARDEKLAMNLLVVPLSFVAAAEIAPALKTAAREFGELSEKLAEAREQNEQLVAYRQRLALALDQVTRALETTGATLREQRSPGGPLTREVYLRARGRLDERASVLDVASRRQTNVQALIDARVDYAFDAEGASADRATAPFNVHKALDGSLDITNSRALALIASCTATALSNIVRHASPTSVQIELKATAPDRLCLRITNDGVPAERDGMLGRPGSGLAHLRWQAESMGGALRWGTTDSGEWFQELDLPAEPSILLGRGPTAERMIALVNGALRTSTRICAVMVASMALEGRQMEQGHLQRTRGLTALALALAEYLDRSGRLEGTPDAPSRWSTALMATTAIASAASPHHEHSLWSGWANSALSRHALRCSRTELAVLTAAHAGAIAVSYRGDLRGAIVMASHEIAITLMGPLAVTLGALPLLRTLERDERALQQSLTEIAQMHDLAESFHTAHPVSSPLEQLEHDLADSPEAATQLAGARAALTDAARALPPAQTARGFAEQFAGTLAARLWPASVVLETNDEMLGLIDAEAAVAVDFRRPALEVADQLGDLLAERFPSDWLARPTLQNVRLRVTAEPHTDAILMQIVPTVPGSPIAAATNNLADALAQAGGFLREGHADQAVTFTFLLKRYRTGLRAA